MKLSGEGVLLWERSWTVSGNEVWAHGAALDESGVLAVSGFIRRVLVDGVSLPDSGYLLGISPEGELLVTALGLGDAGLTSVAVTLPLVDGLLAVGDAGGTLGGDADADVVLMHLILP